jgi:hypothetical protein
VRHTRWPLRLVAAGSIALSGGVLADARQAGVTADALMARVGERVAAYYQRAQRVICINESTVQPVSSALAFVGASRTVESELRVESTTGDARRPPEATMVREVKRINGREPRERDKTDRSGCTDPNPLSPEPLAFLLPGRRGEYTFTSVRSGKEKDRAAFLVDFESANRSSALELVEDPHGHEDCFDWSGPLATSGRLWVDATTYDVLRVDRHINAPVELRVSARLQWRYGLPAWIVLDRDDQSMRFRPVTFRDPEDVLLLPQSIESLTLLRGGLQSIRRTDTFSRYRRFLGTGRIRTP